MTTDPILVDPADTDPDVAWAPDDDQADDWWRGGAKTPTGANRAGTAAPHGRG